MFQPPCLCFPRFRMAFTQLADLDGTIYLTAEALGPLHSRRNR